MRSRLWSSALACALVVITGTGLLMPPRAEAEGLPASPVAAPVAVATPTTGAGRYGIAAGAALFTAPDASFNADLDAIANLGARWLRAPLKWRNVEGAGKGQFDWSIADRLVNGATSRGLGPVVIVNGTPDWAGGGGDPARPPTNLADYADFLQACVTRYRDSVHVWELGNEPNHDTGWKPTPDPVRYADLLKLTYPAVKAADPTATVLTGGIGGVKEDATSIPGDTFVAELYQNGAGPYFDALSYHPYTYPYSPYDTLPPNVDRGWAHMLNARQIMVDNGDSQKQIWATEYGAPTNGPSADRYVSEDRQAQLVDDAYQLFSTYPWAGPLMWFQHRDKDAPDPGTQSDWFGLLRTNLTDKPAAVVFRAGVVRAAGPTHVALSLDPSSVLADGFSTVTATVTITNSDGHGVPGQSPTLVTSGDVTFGSTTDNGDGTYSTTITASTTGGNETITASDGDFSASTVLYETKPTATALASSSNPATYGNSVTFTATVTSTGGTPTGTVSFFDGASLLGTAAVGGTGRAQLATTALSGGTHPITAAYGGDRSFGPSTSPPLSETVNPTGSSTALTGSPNPSPLGDPVTLTAAVTTNRGTPTGTVTFRDGAAVIGSAPLDGTGHATLTTSGLTMGSHPLAAAYGGDATFKPSSGSRSQTVSKGATATALASSANPAPYGAALTFTATVTSRAGIPTGKVTFKSGSTTIGSALLDGAGRATLGGVSLTTATNAVTATYGGAATLAPSTSPVLSQAFINVPSTVALATPSNPVTAPNTFNLTATVTSAGGRPTGSVGFYDGATLLGTGTLDSRGQATLGGVALSPGGHVLTARYGGDANFVPSTSPVLFERVKRSGAPSPAIALASSANPSTSGQAVTFTATVTGSGAVPSGLVTFFDGGAVLGSAPVDASGRAVLTTSSLTVARHTVTAGYGGDATFNPNISSAVTQTVN